MRNLASLILFAIAACAQPGMTPSTMTPEAAPPDAVVKVDWQAADNAEKCAVISGEWRPICMMQKPACVVTYKDAGKSCTDSSQCSGRCQTSGAEPGTETRGQCTTVSDPCGCFQTVEDGKAGYPLCAD